VSPPPGEEEVKGIMLHMILNLTREYSSTNPATLELLLQMFNRDAISAVSARGSPEEDRFC